MYPGLRRISRMTRINPRVRMAMRAYNIGRRVVPTVRRGLLMRKRLRTGMRGLNNFRKKRRLLYTIGERIGSGTTNRTEQEGQLGGAGAVATRTLYQLDLFDNFNKSAGAMGADDRLTDKINLRGVKMCWHFRNLSTGSTQPLQVHLAVVSKKADDGTNVSNTDFFRSQGGNNRFKDFDNALTGMEFQCLPINTDLYNIHKHQRFMLRPGAETSAPHNREIDFYMPIKRQLRFDDTSSVAEGKHMHVVVWCDFPEQAGGSAGLPSICRADYRIVKYFRQQQLS